MDEFEHEEKEIDLAEYWHVLVKHRALIVASVLVVVAVAMIATYRMAPVYQAGATVIIDRERQTSLTGANEVESYGSQAMTFNTHLKLITSRPVIDKVIDRLELDRTADTEKLETGLVSQALTQLKANLRLLLGRQKKPLTDEERRVQLVRALQRKFDIENVRDTRLLRINVEDQDPELTASLANTLAAAYIDFNISNRLESSQNTLSWMTSQLYEVKKKLEDAEQEFLAYRQNEKIFSIEGKQKVIDQKITDFNDAYLAARNKRLELDAKLARLDQYLDGSGDIAHVRSILNNPLIESLYSQLIEAEVELNRLGKVYKGKHPKVVQARSRIADLRQEIKDQLAKEKESLRVERSVLLAREGVLENTTEDFEQDALDTNRKALEYTILQRNVETNRQLYDVLLSRIQEADVTGDQDASNIRVVEAATVPLAPAKPNKKLNLLLSLVVGLMAGVGLAFLREYLDRTLRNEEDVQRYLDLPVLAVVPQVEPPAAPPRARRKTAAEKAAPADG